MKIVTSSLLALLSSSSLPTMVQSAGNLLECVQGEADVDFDYFPDKFTPPEINTYGSDVDIFGNKFVPHNTTDLLTITYHKTYKIVENKHQNKSYLLYQCGTTPPKEEVDSGRHHLVLPIPHKGKLAVTETPQIPPIELLGLREEMIGYIGNPTYVSSPCMKHMMNESTIETVWDLNDPWNATQLEILTEDFRQRHPEVLIFGGPFGDKDGDRVMSVAASQERTNVATFDWIAMYAALYNLEALSNTIASETQARYDCSASNAKLLSAQEREERERRLIEEEEFEEQQRNLAENAKPVVLWARYFTGYNWSIAECHTWDQTYYCEYAEHCGSEIISRPADVGYAPESLGGSYWYVNDDELLELGKDADVWIFTGSNWDDIYEDKKELMDQFKSVQNKAVFDTQGMGSNSWYEQRLAEYDVVALDFCDIVGTVNPDATHTRRWFRNLYSQPIGSLEQCNLPEELSQPYVPRGAECTPLDVKVKDDEVEDDENVKVKDDEVEDDDENAASVYSISALIIASVTLCASVLVF